MRFLTSYRLLSYFLLVAMAAGLAWQVQVWRYEAQIQRLAAIHARELDQQHQLAVRHQQAEHDKRLALEQKLSANDQQHAQELSDAQRHQAALRDRLATADVRLSVLLDTRDPANGCAVPAPTTASGPAHAQRIIAITDDGDNALIALRACQAYVRTIAR